MPAYFRFLTVMAFNVFLKEKVCTNSCKCLCFEGWFQTWAWLLSLCAGGCCCGRGRDWRNIRLYQYYAVSPPSLPHFLSLPPSLACFLSLLPPIFPPSPLPPTLSPSPPLPPSQPHSLHSNPRVTAITSLGYDHMDILGDTLAKIAWQKGGICKVSPCTLSQSTNCCWMS